MPRRSSSVTVAGDGARHPTLCALAQHDCLRIEPAALVEQPAQLAAVLAVLLDRVFVVNAGDEALVHDIEQRQARRLVNAAALGLNDAVLNLVAHAQAVPAADAVGFEQQFHRVGEVLPVERNRRAFVEA